MSQQIFYFSQRLSRVSTIPYNYYIDNINNFCEKSSVQLRDIFCQEFTARIAHIRRTYALSFSLVEGIIPANVPKAASVIDREFRVTRGY